MKRTRIALIIVFLALLLAGCDCFMGDACSDFWRPVVEATEQAAK